MTAHRKRGIGTVAVQEHETGLRELLEKKRGVNQAAAASLDYDAAAEPGCHSAEQLRAMLDRRPLRPRRHIFGEFIIKGIRILKGGHRKNAAKWRHSGDEVEPASERPKILVALYPRTNKFIIERGWPGNCLPELCTAHFTSRDMIYGLKKTVPELTDAKHLWMHVEHARQHGGTTPAGS